MAEIYQIIKIGKRRAIISKIYDDNSVEVVYSDSGKHINEDAINIKDKWEFKDKNISGGYADHYPRLQTAIRLLGE